MKEKLVLVTLTEEQIVKAKEVNGSKNKITHALLCGSLGQMFGTEKQCNKYYSAWNSIYPLVFEHGVETDDYEIIDYKSTFNLVNIIIERNDNPKKSTTKKSNDPKAKKGFFAKLFGA